MSGIEKPNRSSMSSVMQSLKRFTGGSPLASKRNSYASTSRDSVASGASFFPDSKRSSMSNYTDDGHSSKGAEGESVTSSPSKNRMLQLFDKFKSSSSLSLPQTASNPSSQKYSELDLSQVRRTTYNSQVASSTNPEHTKTNAMLAKTLMDRSHGNSDMASGLMKTIWNRDGEALRNLNGENREAGVNDIINKYLAPKENIPVPSMPKQHNPADVRNVRMATYDKYASTDSNHTRTNAALALSLMDKTGNAQESAEAMGKIWNKHGTELRKLTADDRQEGVNKIVDQHFSKAATQRQSMQDFGSARLSSPATNRFSAPVMRDAATEYAKTHSELKDALTKKFGEGNETQVNRVVNHIMKNNSQALSGLHDGNRKKEIDKLTAAYSV